MRRISEDYGNFHDSFKLCRVEDIYLDLEYWDILKGETLYLHLRVGLQSFSFVDDESLDSVEVCLVRRVLIWSPLDLLSIPTDLCGVSIRFNRSEQAACCQKIQGEVLFNLPVSGELSPLLELLLGLPRQNELFSLRNLKYFMSLIQLLYSEWNGEFLEGRDQFCFSLQPFSNWQVLVQLVIIEKAGHFSPVISCIDLPDLCGFYIFKGNLNLYGLFQIAGISD